MPVSQLRDLAKMRAIVVLPTPRVPVNKKRDADVAASAHLSAHAPHVVDRLKYRTIWGDICVLKRDMT